MQGVTVVQAPCEGSVGPCLRKQVVEQGLLLGTEAQLRSDIFFWNICVLVDSAEAEMSVPDHTALYDVSFLRSF